MSEDTFKILVATDNHLGYLEKDGVRGNDSYVTFEEILQIGVKEKVDFFLLAGDLFHENKPSVSALHKCTELLRKYTMGDKPVEFEFLSDPALNFDHNKHFPWVNYEDPNLNIAYPVFSIHGNHDDPLGPDAECALDIFSASGLVNLFGKYTSVQKIEIAPILLKKGSTRLALYGLGAVRDERLHRMFVHDQVSMLRPQENKEDWFSLFAVHQNRSKHGATNYLPEQFLDNFLDLVIWGHEHDCRIDPEWNSQQEFFVCQPGSSVATSLCEGESSTKHVGVLEVRGMEFKMHKVRLQTVRPFLVDEVFLEDVDSLRASDPNIATKVQRFCQTKVEEMIDRVELEASGHPRQPKEPLIRLRIDHSGGFESFSAQRFGQHYVERVANPKDMVHFHRRRDRARRESSGLGGHLKLDAEGAARLSSALDATRVEDLVRQFFSKGDDKVQMTLLTEKELGLAVTTFVEKQAKDAIERVVDMQVTRARKHLSTKNVRDEDDILDEIAHLKEEKERRNEEEEGEDPDVLRVLQEAARAVPAADSDSPAEEEAVGQAVPARSTRGAGSRGRGSRGRGRGRKTAAAELFDDEAPEPPRKSTRGGRGRRGRAGANMTLEAAFGRRSQASAREDDPLILDDSEDDDTPFMKASRSARSSRKRTRDDSDDDDLSFASLRRKR